LEGNFFHVVRSQYAEKLAEFFRQRELFEATPGTIRSRNADKTSKSTLRTMRRSRSRYRGQVTAVRDRLIAVPMLKDEVLIGAIMIYSARRCGRSATNRSEHHQNFAAQAVNCHREPRACRCACLVKSLQQQTATAERWLKVHSVGPTFDLETVLRTLV
jgi:hypothetical protein